MAENFLYILGAGASCEAVPLVKDFPDSLAAFANELRSIPAKVEPQTPVYNVLPLYNHEMLDPTAGFVSGEARTEFVEALSWLATEASHHASVDTLAKKFYLKKEHHKLKKLKAVLSSFLVVVQGRREVDKRYDSFMASVLYRNGSDRLQIPDNIQIMTWNYDTQLENAFYGFVEDNNEVYDKISHSDRIHRINGCCGKTPDNHWGKDFNSVWEAPDVQTAMVHGIGLFNDYLEHHNTPDADIRFAWEDKTNVYLTKILQAIKETTVAVVIGYSFPYFNRDIDKKIFNAMPLLKRVYLQYPDGAHSAIRERVQAMRPSFTADSIHSVTVDNQFYIPDEYAGPV